MPAHSAFKLLKNHAERVFLDVKTSAFRKNGSHFFGSYVFFKWERAGIPFCILTRHLFRRLGSKPSWTLPPRDQTADWHSFELLEIALQRRSDINLRGDQKLIDLHVPGWLKFKCEEWCTRAAQCVGRPLFYVKPERLLRNFPRVASQFVLSIVSTIRRENCYW